MVFWWMHSPYRAPATAACDGKTWQSKLTQFTADPRSRDKLEQP